MKILAPFLLALPFYTVSAAAETAWVTEDLKITLRSGESTRHKILRELYVGSSLTVVSENPETGFTKVITEKGHEGYVMSRFVSAEKPYKVQLAEAKAQLKTLGKGNAGEQLNLLQNTIDELNAELGQLEAENRKLNDELTQINAASGDAIKISEQHLDVLERNELLENQLSVAQAENMRLSDNRKREGYIHGVIAMIIGMIAALVIPNLKGSKRNSEWS